MKGERLLAIVLGGLVSIVGMSAYSTPPTVKYTTSTSASYRAGSVESHEVAAWLARNAKVINGESLGDLSKLGDIQVTYTHGTSRAPTDASASSAGGGPPVSLPMSGNPGDQISITSSSGGYSQLWTYQWQGSPVAGNWVLIEYHYFKNNPA